MLGHRVFLDWGLWFGHIVNQHCGRKLHITGRTPRDWVFFPDYEMEESRDATLELIKDILRNPDRVIVNFENGQQRDIYIRDCMPPIVASPIGQPVVVIVARETAGVISAYPSTNPVHRQDFSYLTPLYQRTTEQDCMARTRSALYA